MAGRPPHDVLMRRRAVAIALAVALLLALATALGDEQPASADPVAMAAAGAAAAEDDRFAYDPDRQADFEVRAAFGSARVIYEKSPGGVVESAARTARFRDRIEEAAAAHDADPDLMEAMVMLESAGRTQVFAGPTPESASGLAQILPSTATDLLEMEVDLARSRALTRRLGDARSRRGVERLISRRAAIDERFDPEAALDGMGRYLEIATEEFGREDLAVASYHMGIGNLTDVIQHYAGVDSGDPREIAESQDLSYAQLFFGSSPTEHEQAWSLLAGFGDDSSTYYWRVLAAAEIMRLWRDEPDELERLAGLFGSAATAEAVFHPPEQDQGDGSLVAVPAGESHGYAIEPRLGSEASLSVHPVALATLAYIATQVRAISGEEHLTLAGAAGYGFSISRRYESDDQAEAFQFTLDRLRALAVIDYAVERSVVRVAVSDLASELLE